MLNPPATPGRDAPVPPFVPPGNPYPPLIPPGNPPRAPAGNPPPILPGNPPRGPARNPYIPPPNPTGPVDPFIPPPVPPEDPYMPPLVTAEKPYPPTPWDYLPPTPQSLDRPAPEIWTAHVPPISNWMSHIPPNKPARQRGRIPPSSRPASIEDVSDGSTTLAADYQPYDGRYASDAARLLGLQQHKKALLSPKAHKSASGKGPCPRGGVRAGSVFSQVGWDD